MKYRRFWHIIITMWIGFAGELSFAQTSSKDSVVIHFPQGKAFDYRRLTYLLEIDSNVPHRKEVLKIFQDMVIKTNLPYYAFVVPNIAIERSYCSQLSFPHIGTSTFLALLAAPKFARAFSCRPCSMGAI